MITVRDIEQFLYDWAPPDTAESWDNVGLLVGRPDRPVRRVLVALDVTPAVAAVVCCTLVGTVACAKLVGASLPILAEKIGFDPAVMASPFISTIVDALSLLIYFRFATWILGV